MSICFVSFSRLLSAGYRSVFFRGFWFSFRPAKLVSPARADGTWALTGRRPFKAADKFIWGQCDSISRSPLASPGAWTHFSQPPFGRREEAPGGRNLRVPQYWLHDEEMKIRSVSVQDMTTLMVSVCLVCYHLVCIFIKKGFGNNQTILLNEHYYMD